jgi:hypothetical protein
MADPQAQTPTSISLQDWNAAPSGTPVLSQGTPAPSRQTPTAAPAQTPIPISLQDWNAAPSSPSTSSSTAPPVQPWLTSDSTMPGYGGAAENTLKG